MMKLLENWQKLPKNYQKNTKVLVNGWIKRNTK